MRAFIALTLPEAVRHSLAALQDTLDASRADVRWVDAQQLHLTLKFLDDITDEQRQAVEALLVRIAQETPVLALSLEGVGAFPSMRAPRVVWVGVKEGQDDVTRLARAIEAASAALSVRRELRPFAAHVTLGRVRSSRHLSMLTRRLEQMTWQPPQPWTARAVTLYESRLGSSGATHIVLANVPFGGSMHGEREA